MKGGLYQKLMVIKKKKKDQKVCGDFDLQKAPTLKVTLIFKNKQFCP